MKNLQYMLEKIAVGEYGLNFEVATQEAYNRFSPFTDWFTDWFYELPIEQKLAQIRPLVNEGEIVLALDKTGEKAYKSVEYRPEADNIIITLDIMEGIGELK